MCLLNSLSKEKDWLHVCKQGPDARWYKSGQLSLLYDWEASKYSEEPSLPRNKCDAFHGCSGSSSGSRNSAHSDTPKCKPPCVSVSAQATSLRSHLLCSPVRRQLSPCFFARFFFTTTITREYQLNIAATPAMVHIACKAFTSRSHYVHSEMSRSSWRSTLLNRQVMAVTKGLL